MKKRGLWLLLVLTVSLCVGWLTVSAQTDTLQFELYESWEETLTGAIPWDETNGYTVSYNVGERKMLFLLLHGIPNFDEMQASDCVGVYGPEKTYDDGSLLYAVELRKGSYIEQYLTLPLLESTAVVRLRYQPQGRGHYLYRTNIDDVFYDLIEPDTETGCYELEYTDGTADPVYLRLTIDIEDFANRVESNVNFWGGNGMYTIEPRKNVSGSPYFSMDLVDGTTVRINFNAPSRRDQLYLGYDAENEMPVNPVDYADTGFSVDYTPGQSKTVYYVAPADVDSAQTHMGSMSINLWKHFGSFLYKIEIPANISGYQEAKIALTDGSEAAITFRPDNLQTGVYKDWACTIPLEPSEDPEPIYTSWYIPEERDQVLYYYSAEEITEFTHSDGGINVKYISVNGVPDHHRLQFRVFAPEGGTFETDVTVNDQTTFTVMFGMDGTPEHTIRDTEVLPQTYRNSPLGPVPFTCDVNDDGMIKKDEMFWLGVTFNPAWNRNGGMVHPGEMSHSDTANAQTCRFLKLGFWVKETDGYHAVPKEIEQAILAKTENLTLDLYADEQNVGLYPHWIVENVNYPFEQQFCFSRNNNGYWYFVATGTIDGQRVCSVNRQGFFLKVALEETCNTIAEANAFLQEMAADPSRYPEAFVSIQINLRGQALGTGTDASVLVVPAGLPEIRIMGDYGENNTEKHARLYGALENHSTVIIKNVDFVGAGKTENFGRSQLDETDDGNCAIYGSGHTQYDFCTFTGYTVAVKSVDGFCFGGEGNTFEENNVAYYMNLETFPGGNVWMKGNTFCSNDVAVWIEKLALSDEIEPWQYTIANSFFIDNGAEFFGVKNTPMFFPGNYFEKNGSSLARTTNVLIGKQAVEMENGCQVSVYPAALDKQFQSFEYAVDEAVISNDLSYQIPVAELANTYTVVDDNQAVLTMSFEQPSVLFSKMAGRAAENPVFDPKVELSRTDTEILLTLPAMPEGKHAAVSVLCADWESTVVYRDETVIAAEVADGKVTFPAAGPSAAYRICRGNTEGCGVLRLVLTDLEGVVLSAIPQGGFTVSADAVKDESSETGVLVLAVYNAAGKQIALQFRTLAVGVQTVKLDVTDPDHDAAKIKAFVLKESAGGYLPVDPAVEWKAAP